VRKTLDWKRSSISMFEAAITFTSHNVVISYAWQQAKQKQNKLRGR
jgi:hypothetical protein